MNFEVKSIEETIRESGLINNLSNLLKNECDKIDDEMIERKRKIFFKDVFYFNAYKEVTNSSNVICIAQLKNLLEDADKKFNIDLNLDSNVDSNVDSNLASNVDSNVNSNDASNTKSDVNSDVAPIRRSSFDFDESSMRYKVNKVPLDGLNKLKNKLIDFMCTYEKNHMNTYIKIMNEIRNKITKNSTKDNKQIEELISYNDQLKEEFNKNKRRFFAVDGTVLTLPINLIKSGYDTSRNNSFAYVYIVVCMTLIQIHQLTISFQKRRMKEDHFMNKLNHT
jgi:hypothetical protein